MENFTFQLTPEMLALVPVVAGVMQMLKRIPQIAAYKEWLPVVSILLGIGAGMLLGTPAPIVPGVVIGLTAAGGYDLMKNGTKP
jgi:hypothetical protein